MSKRGYRSVQILLLFITIIVLWMSFYFQWVLGLQPCPLCLMQRFCVFLLMMFFLMGLCLSTLSRGRLVAIMQIGLSVAGLFFACRQLWLQSLPIGQVPACLPGLDILIHYFPWQDLVHALFWGTGECAEVTWTFWGLTMPAWSGLYFLLMLMVSSCLYVVIQRSISEQRL